MQRIVDLSLTTIALGAALLVAATSAHAGDGRIEINQSCALVGCVPGDAPGFPVTVGPGSYILTGHLTVGSPATGAIAGTTDVSIDLNGFSITGVTTCTGVPAACTGAGAGIGISLLERGTVRNGTIRRMGSDGIRGSAGLLVEDVVVSESGGDGITASDKGQQIRRCRIFQNGGDGISFYFSGSAGALIEGNTMHGNHRYGADVIAANVIGNTVTSNGEEGLYMVSGTSFRDNKLSENNGGNANDQIFGGVEAGVNVCGNAVCP